MGKTSLPPGFRFHPTDLELVLYYLKRKIMGRQFRFEVISEIELYKFAPWDLPDKSCLQSKDLEWYFFCPRDKKYSNSSRKNRATDIGYWKTTGKDRSISYNSQIVATKKTLVFHEGRVSKGARTDWVMHEYRLEDKKLVDAGFLQDAYVLCRIFKKRGPGPKIGEQYGAPFREEDWEDDEVIDSSVLVPPTHDGSVGVLHQILDKVLHSDVDSIPAGSSESVNVDKLLQEPSQSNNNEISVAQDGEMPDSFISRGALAEETTAFDRAKIYDGLQDLPCQVELQSADDTYFSNSMGEIASEHNLLDLSNQVESRSIDNIQQVMDDGYMERDFLFSEINYSELAPDNLFGSLSSQNLNNIGILPVNDNRYDASPGIIYPWYL